VAAVKAITRQRKKGRLAAPFFVSAQRAGQMTILATPGFSFSIVANPAC
jgi:hypothetical protein